jgi:hypothetical protein
VLPVAGVEVITPTAQAPVAGSPWTATPLRDAPAPAPAEQGIALDAETEAALVDALTSARQRLVALCLCVALFGVSLIVALSVGASSPDADAAAGTTTVGNHAVEGGGR